jgi:hypothetical protein
MSGKSKAPLTKAELAVQNHHGMPCQTISNVHKAYFEAFCKGK